MSRSSVLGLVLLSSAAALAAPVAVVAVGEEVEVMAGAVTGLSCALAARDQGNIEALTSCPLEEATKEIVLFDVAEKQIYRLDSKKVRRFELEKAFAGGSIDFTGVVKKITAGIAVVEVKQYSVNPRPKPGAFKGCL